MKIFRWNKEKRHRCPVCHSWSIFYPAKPRRWMLYRCDSEDCGVWFAWWGWEPGRTLGWEVYIGNDVLAYEIDRLKAESVAALWRAKNPQAARSIRVRREWP